MHDPVDAAQLSPAMITPGSAAASKPDRSLWAIVLMAFLAMAGAVALLPSSGEKAEALAAEGRFNDAIAILNSVEQQRPLDVYESYLLFKLYVMTKQPDSAASLIDSQLAVNPQATGGINQLAALYRDNHDYAAEAAVLRKFYDTGPNQPAFDRLRVLYRLIGDAAAEASLLVKGIAAGQTKPEDLQRLIALQSAMWTGAQVAVWADPSGSFAKLGSTRALLPLAVSDPTTFPVNFRE